MLRWPRALALGLAILSAMGARAERRTAQARTTDAVTSDVGSGACLPLDDRGRDLHEYLDATFMRPTPMAQGMRATYGMIIAGPSDLRLVTVDSVCARASAAADAALDQPASGQPAHVFAAGNRYIVIASRFAPPSGSTGYSVIVVLDSSYGFVRLLGF
jgi:hypothetical protein